jgi:hypothetical protein
MLAASQSTSPACPSCSSICGCFVKVIITRAKRAEAMISSPHAGCLFQLYVAARAKTHKF